MKAENLFPARVPGSRSSPCARKRVGREKAPDGAGVGMRRARWGNCTRSPIGRAASHGGHAARIGALGVPCAAKSLDAAPWSGSSQTARAPTTWDCRGARCGERVRKASKVLLVGAHDAAQHVARGRPVLGGRCDVKLRRVRADAPAAVWRRCCPPQGGRRPGARFRDVDLGNASRGLKMVSQDAAEACFIHRARQGGQSHA